MVIFMTATSSVVKLTAKTALKNNWPKAAAVCVISVCARLIVGLTASLAAYMANGTVGIILSAVLSFFILLPLFLGVIRFFWRMIFSADDSPVLVFYYFSGKKHYMRAVKLAFLLTVRALFFGIILLIPAMIVDLFAGSFLYDALNIATPLWTTNLYYLSLFLKTVAFVILAFIIARYYIAPFLLIADEEMEAAEAIHMSDVISKSTILDFIYLFFSLIGWIALSVLVVPIIFTLPYIITSFSVHVRFAVAEYNKRVDKLNSDSFPTFVAGI